MYRVLIAEDDPMVAMINEKYVSRQPEYKVVGKVRNGKEALEFLEKNPVDLVILDVYMPVMDGIEVLTEIRNRALPVEIIMVTAANDRDTLERALHSGVVDYLVKPFNLERFRTALEKFSAQRAVFDTAEEFSQSSIDHLVANAAAANRKELPKGIQEKTLHTLTEYLNWEEGAYRSCEEIAEHTGLTIVTVRRYMTYLESTGEAESMMNYETGGRPQVLYRMRG